MMRNVNVVVCVMVVALVANLGGCSLLPFLDRSDVGPADIMLRDPFRILEHIPFGLDRDDIVVPPARVDWKETPTSHLIMLDVPGLKREELKIEVEEKRILRVSGERKREEEKKEDKWHRVERAYGKFWRQFRLPENADLDTVNAELKHGVLTITFNKIPSDKIKTPRVVSIIGGGDEEEHNKVDDGRKTEF